MESLLHFFSLSDPNIRYVVLGTILLTSSSAMVGCFTFLRKRSLIGDAVAHAVLPGVCLAFILSGNKNPVILIIGAFVTGWLSLVSVEFIKKNTRLKEDSSIGLVLSVFFGIGILLLTSIQHSGNASQSGLDSFLFGKAASLVSNDVIVFGIVGLILVISIILFFKEFSLLAFDENFAKTIGFPVKALETVLTTLTVLAVVVGIQAVGVVLMAAMLITPAAAARYWTNRLATMIFIAACMSMFSGIAGAFISYQAPKMPTGPWMVLVISFIAVISFFFAPQKGVMYRWKGRRNNKIRILEENILKAMYQLGEIDKDFYRNRMVAELLNKREFEQSLLLKGIRQLTKQGFVKNTKGQYALTEAGKNKGQRITRLHRLWEMYLTEYVNLAPDHVHEDAETIEHIITPELEKKLEEQLKYPTLDPHASEIPYKKF